MGRDDRLAGRRLALRAALVVAATAAIALLLGRLLAGVLLDAATVAPLSGRSGRSGPAVLDAWAGGAAAAGALLTLGWWATSFTVAVVAQAGATIRSGRPSPPTAGTSPNDPTPPHQPAAQPVPSVVRRLAAAALGVALTAGPVTAQAAVDRPAGGTHAPTGAADITSTTHSTHPTGGAWSPDRPAARAVVVRPGDTLWTLAAARLRDGDRPDPRAVAAAWPRWWHANRAVVGPDPDLIRPGQVLHPPTVPEEDR